MTQAGVAGRQVEETFRRFGSLINFAMIVIGFAVAAMTVGSWRTTQETNDAKTAEWQLNHEQLHRERLADVKEVQGAVNSRLSGLDKGQQDAGRAIDNLEQRLATVEKAVNTVEQNAALTNRTLNEMNGNLQVVKEILNRIEKKQGG